MKVSVVICAYNEEDYLEDCLKYVIKNATSILHEIIIINNASTDKTAQVAKKFSGVKVINEEKKGLSFARQRGLIEAEGDLLAYIDADTHICKDWFKIIEKEFLQDKDLVCLSGPYYYYNISKLEQLGVKFYWKYLATPAYSVTSFLVLGGNFVAKKSALLAMGGFDTSIAFYGEDVDIGRRLNKVGKVRFLKNFYVYTSPRRFESEGFLRTGLKYMQNYIWEAAFSKPFTKTYKDIR